MTSRRAAAVRAIGILLCAVAALVGCSSTTDAGKPAASSEYADVANSAACTQLRQQHPNLVGKTMTNALNPYTPGYETVDPNDPGRYQGFDIDLGNAIGACLGFSVDYVSVGFSELIPTVSSGRADWILSNLYATKERAQGGVDFVSYSKVFDGILVKNGNPKKMSRCHLSTPSGPNAKRRASPRRPRASSTTAPTACKRSWPAEPTPT